MRCNCCDRVLGDGEILPSPDNKTFEPCATCMEIIMDAAYSDGFTRPVDEEFEVDEDTDKMVVKVIDKETGEMIRQMPSEEVIRIAKVLGKMQGMLVSETA